MPLADPDHDGVDLEPRRFRIRAKTSPPLVDAGRGAVDRVRARAAPKREDDVWALAELSLSQDVGMGVPGWMIEESIVGGRGLCRVRGEVPRAECVKISGLALWI